MSSRLPEIAHVLDESLEQVTFTEDEYVVEALATHTAQEALAECRLPQLDRAPRKPSIRWARAEQEA